MTRRLGTVLVLAAAAAGCASTWSLRGQDAAVALQWPFAPNRAKVTYVRSLTGVDRHGNGGARLAGIVTGKDAAAGNAFVLPVAVATGRDDRLAVADTGRRGVHLVQPATHAYQALCGTKQEPLVSPVGVAFDDDLRLWVTDSSGKLFAFGADGRPLLVRTKAGDAPLLRPTGVAYGAAKRLVYVVDTVACAVHAFRADDGAFAFSFGKRGTGAGEFNFPTSIFRTAGGELFVTDSLNFRVAIFDDAGTPRGAFGHHGDGSGDMALPKGLAVDGDGVVYVADALLDNVQLFDRSGGFLVTVGQRGFGDGEFWLPSGVFISGKGELYVCDTYNRRIQVFRITERYDHAS